MLIINELIEAINSIGTRDLFDYLNLIISVIAILISIGATIINVWLVNKNTNKQIENQNKNTYMPRLRLINLKRADLDSEKAHYWLNFNNVDVNSSLYVVLDMELENIGYGIANDISFYDLKDGIRIYITQSENPEISQLTASTTEITQSSKATFRFICWLETENELLKYDELLLICKYEDLNKNEYKLLIGCKPKMIINNLKTTGSSDVTVDFYYYQEDTKEFNKIVNNKKYVDKYKRIIGKY